MQDRNSNLVKNSFLKKIKIERISFIFIVSLTLAPVICQGFWRPLATFLNANGNAALISLSSLGVALTVFVLFLLTSFRTRWNLAIAGIVVGTIFAFLIGKEMQDCVAIVISLFFVSIGLSLLVPWLYDQLPQSLDGLASRNRFVSFLFVVSGLICIVQTTRVSIFIGDPNLTEYQATPGDSFLARHSCLTAYSHATGLATSRVDNIYDSRWWPASGQKEASIKTEMQSKYEPFDLDTFAYPPPFLLLTSSLHFLKGNYPSQRAAWFGINGLFLALGLWVMARYLGGDNWHRALLLTPLIWVSLPTLITLQIGNFQTSVIVASILAMISFEKKRPVIGGALLSFAILSKIAPGVLALWLLLQRRWRDAFWTAGFGIIWLCLSILVFGFAPLYDFITYEIPRINSGEALEFLAEPGNILINLSPFGFPFRLTLFGFTISDPWAMAKKLSTIFTIVLILVTIISGLRKGNHREHACTWLALVTLAAFRSPFTPGYVLFGALWLLSFLSLEVHQTKYIIAMSLLWLMWSFPPPFSQTVTAAFGFIPIFLIFSVLIWVAVRRPKVAIEP